MGGGPGKKIRQFSLKTEACASSYGLLQFCCFDDTEGRVAKKSFFEKFDLGLLSTSIGMDVSRGKEIMQFPLKTEACASSYGLLQFWCFDTKGPRAAAGAFFC